MNQKMILKNQVEEYLKAAFLYVYIYQHKKFEKIEYSLAYRIGKYLLKCTDNNRKNCRMSEIYDGHWGVALPQKLLAKLLNVSERAVRRALAVLIQDGFLCVGKRDRERSNQNYYYINCNYTAATEADYKRAQKIELEAELERNREIASEVERLDTAILCNEQMIKNRENKIKKILEKMIKKCPQIASILAENQQADHEELARVYKSELDFSKNKKEKNIKEKSGMPIEVTETASVVSPADGIAASGGKLPEPKKVEVDVSSVQSPAFGAQGLPAKRAESPNGMTLQEKQAQFLAEMKRGREERLPLENLRDIYERAKRFADESVIGVSFAYRAQLRYFEGIFRPDSEKQTI